MAVVEKTVDGRGVATVLLNRPEKHNAFDDALIAALLQECGRIAADRDIRVVVLTGAGRSFCAGADLSWMRSMASYDMQRNRDDALQLAELMKQWYQLPQPTVARVNGDAYGGACGLIACSDIAVAADHASLGFTEVKLGLVPAVISPFVVQAIGPRWAKALFLTGEVFGARRAERINLVHEVVPGGDLDDAVERYVELLLQGGPQAQRHGKRLVDYLLPIDDSIHQYTSNMIAQLRSDAEGQEGMSAFLDKRKPAWRQS